LIACPQKRRPRLSFLEVKGRSVIEATVEAGEMTGLKHSEMRAHDG
jgi:hypothetical protein